MYRLVFNNQTKFLEYFENKFEKRFQYLFHNMYSLKLYLIITIIFICL